jgi:hypothetical protein
MTTWTVDVRAQSIAELKASNYDPVVGTEPCRNSGTKGILCFQKSFILLKTKIFIRFLRLLYVFSAHSVKFCEWRRLLTFKMDSVVLTFYRFQYSRTLRIYCPLPELPSKCMDIRFMRYVMPCRLPDICYRV